MKLTGTNRPITYTTHPLPRTRFKRGSHPGVVKSNKPAGYWLLEPQLNNNTTCCNTTVFPTPQGYGTQGYGGHSVGETPGPIPNPEAKTHSADGTAPGRVWESRSPPDNH